MGDNIWIVEWILVLLLSALLMAWVLAVWLPGRAFKRGSKLGLAVFLSLVGFLFTRVGLMATVSGSNGSFLSDMLQYISKHGYGLQYFGFPLLLSVPVMAGAATLLYFGGWAVRFRRSRSAVILGCVGVVFGFLLWIGAALWDQVLIGYLWTI